MSDIADRLAAMAPEDRLYALRTLPAHLAGAGRDDRLRRVLTSLGFLGAKLETVGPEPVIADYELIAGKPLGLDLVQAAIRLAAHVLGADPRQLYGQLAARLDGIGAAAVTDLLGAAPGAPWLRPLTRSLVLAGAPLLRTLTGHTAGAGAIVALPDGTGVVSASEDGTVIVWDVGGGTEVRRIGDPAPRQDQAAGVTALALLSDGRLLIGRRSGALELRDLVSGEAAGTLPHQPDGIGGIAAFPDGRRVATATMRGHLRVYDLETGTALHAFDATDGTSIALTIAPGDRVAYGAGRRAALWSPETGENRVLSPFEDVYVMMLETLADGHVLAAARDGFVRVWDADSGRTVNRFLVSADAAVAAARPLPGGRILTGTWDGRLDAWDASTGARLGTVGGAGQLRALAVLPDGRRAVTGGPDGVLRVWDLAAPPAADRESSPREHERAVYRIALPDPRRAISLAHDGKLEVWAVEDGRELLAFQLHDAVTAPGGWLMAAAGGNRVVAASGRGEMASFALEVEGAVVRWQGHAVAATALAGLPDGRRALSAGLGGEIRVWDVRSGAEVGAIDVRDWGVHPRKRIRALCALRDGHRALAVFAEDPIRIFDIGSGALLGSLPADVSFHACVADDDVILGRRDGRWEFRDAATGALTRTLPAPPDPIDEVIVAAGGVHALTLFANGLIDVWRLDDGRSICGFGADAPLAACAIADDGRSVVAGDRTGRVHFLALEGGSRPARLAAEPRRDAARWRFWRRRT